MANTMEKAGLRLCATVINFTGLFGDRLGHFSQLLFISLAPCPIQFGSIDIPSPHLHNPSLPPDMTGRQQGIYTLTEKLAKVIN